LVGAVLGLDLLPTFREQVEVVRVALEVALPALLLVRLLLSVQAVLVLQPLRMVGLVAVLLLVRLFRLLAEVGADKTVLG
jgi:hypothetical protein